MAREVGSGSQPERERAPSPSRSSSSASTSKNTGSRDTVAQREEGKKTADRLVSSGSLVSGGSSTRQPVATGSRDTVAQRAAGTRTAQSLASGSGSRATTPSRAQVSAPSTSLNQSTMRPGGFDQLMRELDAGTTTRSGQPNLLDSGQLNAVFDDLAKADALARMIDPSRAVTAGVSFGGIGDAFGNWLEEQNDYREAKIAEREAAGVTPSEGPINWNAIRYDLNAPVRERGVEFEGPVDWGGIGNAISSAFGGIGEALSAPAPRIVEPRVLRDIPTNQGGYVERERPMGRIDPDTGFVQDPETGTWYRPDYSPQEERLVANPLPSFEEVIGPPLQVVSDAAKTLGNLGNLVPTGASERPSQPPVQQDPYYEQPPMPPSTSAPQPRLISDPAQMVWEPAVVEAAEPTVWERAVDMAGNAFDDTLLGGTIKTLFPDFWNESGETIKGNRPMGTLPSSIYPPDSLLEYDRSSSAPNSGLVGFIDMNGNGIDDRLEGYTPPTAGQPPASAPPQISYNDAFFPDMPPYNPGVSPEWQYFRPRAFRHGGYVHGYADGGIVEAVAAESPNGVPPTGGLDPRITIIADAEDALEGEHPNPEEALGIFVEMFGPDALEMLKAQVQSGVTLRGYRRKKPRMAKGRFIEGDGGDKDDAVPARIDDVEEARLSNGEFVITAPAVRAAGDGDPMKGAAKLAQLDAMLAGRDDDGLDVERVR